MTDAGMSRSDREAAQATREVAQRAIRRLDMLEWVMVLGGAVLAMLGGAVFAWLLAGMAGLTFRTTWIVASLVLFVLPGTIAIIMIRRDERAGAERASGDRPTSAS